MIVPRGSRIVGSKRARTRAVPSAERQKNENETEGTRYRETTLTTKMRKEIKCERSWSLAVSRAASIIND